MEQIQVIRKLQGTFYVLFSSQLYQIFVDLSRYFFGCGHPICTATPGYEPSVITTSLCPLCLRSAPVFIIRAVGATYRSDFLIVIVVRLLFSTLIPALYFFNTNLFVVNEPKHLLENRIFLQYILDPNEFVFHHWYNNHYLH